MTMRATRFPLRLPVRYRPLGKPEWRQGQTENISHSGALFRVEAPLPVDTPPPNFTTKTLRRVSWACSSYALEQDRLPGRAIHFRKNKSIFDNFGLAVCLPKQIARLIMKRPRATITPQEILIVKEGRAV